MDQTTNRTEREIWTDGVRGEPICILVDEYKTGTVVASADGEHIADCQLEEALWEVYPSKVFRLRREYGYIFAKSI